MGFERNDQIETHEKQLFELTPELEREFSERIDKLDITDDYLFWKVMEDKELLAELIRLILPDLKFSKLDVQPQKPIKVAVDSHGVRFDIYVTLENGDKVIIEMQVNNKDNLPRRIRYYGSMTDMQMLGIGEHYSKLKDSYVIMICPFDMFEKGRHIYTFKNTCKEDGSIELNDGTTKIVLNAVGTVDDVTGRLKEFLNYVAGFPSDDEYVKKLELAVKSAKANAEWRASVMTLYMRDLENKEIGRQEGRKEGKTDVVIDLVIKGSLSISEGAEVLSMTETDLKNLIKKKSQDSSVNKN